jgi:flagellar basal-body rod protein FlgF
MPYGIYLSAEGAYAQSKRLEVLSNNLANVETPGFKRDLAVIQARYAEAAQQGIDVPGSGSISDLGGGVQVLKTVTDFSAAGVKLTGSQTDMALPQTGDFFVVRKNNQSMLTRAGSFMINSQGRLVTPDGLPVMSHEGEPIDIDPEGGPWRVTPDGGIEQDGEITYVSIVRPRSLGDLVKQGGNMFSSLAPAPQVPIEERQVRPGYLEHSGTEPTKEMVELIETSRAYEANVAMIRNHDTVLNALVNRVPKVS